MQQKKKDVSDLPQVTGALVKLGQRLDVDAQKLKATIVNTCMKMKDRQVTESEFVSFLIVANSYRLNPMTKEIYAFPDKSGGIVPIVSTDGWTRIMTTHPDYQSHFFRYSEDIAETDGAKPCPEWCECVIVKKDGTEHPIREYLDEVYQPPRKGFPGPWQTHTKRMLRHKSKIQAAREVFGFAGIYDQDEGERILDAQTPPPAGKPEVMLPEKTGDAQESNWDQREKTEQERQEDPSAKSADYYAMLNQFKEAKKAIGDEEYYKILGSHSYQKSNEIPDVETGNKILTEMRDRYAELN